MTSDRPKTSFGYHPELQGVRAIAVLAVWLSHIGFTVGRGGALGVDVFFTLSGFLITSLLLIESRRNGRIDLRAFYVRRALRLFPALVVGVLLVGLTVPVLYDHQGRYVIDAGASLLYVNDFVMGWSPHFGALSPTWSLAVEEQFYLLWPPILILLLRRRGLRGVSTFLLAAIAVLVLAKPLLFHLEGPRLYFLPWGHLDGILVGVLAAVATLHESTAAQTIRVASKPLVLYGSAGLVLMLLLFANGYTDSRLYYGIFTMIAAATAVVLVSVTYSPTTRLSRVLRLGPLLWLGERSYGFYLYHYVVILMAEHYFNRTLVVVVASFAVSCLLIEASWRWVELPALRVKKRFERVDHRSSTTGREEAAA